MASTSNRGPTAIGGHMTKLLDGHNFGLGISTQNTGRILLYLNVFAIHNLVPWLLLIDFVSPRSNPGDALNITTSQYVPRATLDLSAMASSSSRYPTVDLNTGQVNNPPGSPFVIITNTPDRPRRVAIRNNSLRNSSGFLGNLWLNSYLFF